MNHNLARVSAPARRFLGDLLPEVLNRFTVTSMCASCGEAVGEGHVSLLLDVSEQAAAARLAHRSCTEPRLVEVVALPLSPESGYQYRTLMLPASQGDVNASLPTLLVRLNVDVVLLVPSDGSWQIVKDLGFQAAGFTSPGPVLPYAEPPVRCVPTSAGVDVFLPGGDSITVEDPAFAGVVAGSGGLIVLVLPAGEVSDVKDLSDLNLLLRDPDLLLALVVAEGYPSADPETFSEGGIPN